MDVRGKVAVVTGAASGIGRALAIRIADDGARAVVIADLDEPGLRELGAEIGERASIWCGDVADPDAIERLVRTTIAELGQIDVFCANAGIALGGDRETPDEIWARMLDVNVLAHVRAARALLPGWLGRGEGCLLVTASAAGLLTQLGSATYSTTKHAAVAFAEWLAITYGDRGVQVGCICPMMVRTPMLGGAAGADGVRGALTEDAVRSLSDVIEPDEVADVAIAGLREGRFLILPHADVAEHVRRRAVDHERWLAGMRRLQRSLLPVAAPPATLDRLTPEGGA